MHVRPFLHKWICTSISTHLHIHRASSLSLSDSPHIGFFLALNFSFFFWALCIFPYRRTETWCTNLKCALSQSADRVSVPLIVCDCLSIQPDQRPHASHINASRILCANSLWKDPYRRNMCWFAYCLLHFRRVCVDVRLWKLMAFWFCHKQRRLQWRCASGVNSRTALHEGGSKKNDRTAIWFV